MNRYKKLVTNSFILMFGSIGTKLGSFFLLPLYTKYLTTAEYGIADITFTFINLILPIVTLSIFEMFIKQIIEKPSKRLSYLVSGLFLLTGTNCTVWIIANVCYTIGIIHLQYSIFILMLLLMTLQSFSNIILNYLRAINKNLIYTLTNIIQMVILIISVLVMMSHFKMGLVGYFLANIFSLITVLINLIYIFIKEKQSEEISFDLNFIKKITRDSLPLIPNALMWWGINSADKIFILTFLGVSANGLFAAANKLPMLLAMLSTVFFQAWQISAIEEVHSDNKATFYNTIFSYFLFLMGVGVLLLTLLIKPLCIFILSKNFQEAIQYVPFLILATYFSNIASFLGANCIAFGKTKAVFYSSIICCVVNLILSPIFISVLGIHGAGISATISFFILMLLRLRAINKLLDTGYTQSTLLCKLLPVILSVALFSFTRVYIILFLGLGLIIYQSKKQLFRGFQMGKLYLMRHRKKFKSY